MSKSEKMKREYLEKGGEIHRCPPRYAEFGISRRKLPVRATRLYGSGEGCYGTNSPVVDMTSTTFYKGAFK